MTTKQTPPADRGAVRPKLKRILNSLLVETLVVAAVVGPAVYLWYSYQVNRTADALLERARKLELEEKDYKGAADDYFQYLKLKPNDANAQILLAEAFDRAGKDPNRAIEYYYQAIGVAPDYRPKGVTPAEKDKAKEDTPVEKERALRRRLAELLIERGRFAEAEGEAQRFSSTMSTTLRATACWPRRFTASRRAVRAAVEKTFPRWAKPSCAHRS